MFFAEFACVSESLLKIGLNLELEVSGVSDLKCFSKTIGQIRFQVGEPELRPYRKDHDYLLCVYSQYGSEYPATNHSSGSDSCRIQHVRAAPPRVRNLPRIK